MSAFFHGVSTNRVPTSLLAPRKVASALPVIFGCAPIHRLDADDMAQVKPGKVGRVSTITDAGTMFGIDTARDGFEHWTLSEAAYVYFQMFNVSPAIFVNLFDPTKHKTAVTDEAVTFSAGSATLAHADVIGNVTLDSFTEGTDYHLNRVTGEITILDDGTMTAVTTATASYSYASPDKVTVDDCIGGFDSVTGFTTGIALADDVFPQFGEIPTIGIAPKFGEDPAVAGVLGAKMDAVNGMFKGGVALVDVPAGVVKRYMDVPAYKRENGLNAESMTVCWPNATVGKRTIHMSLIAGARMAATDADNGGTPYVSPSNKHIGIDGLTAGGEEVWLDLQKANYLNANGIVTAIFFNQGWRLWGNRTACYPASSDPAETFISSRRMMGWYGNRLMLTWWDKIDSPMSRRLIETIVNTEQYQLNAMTASGILHGGRIELLEAENNVTDLMNGIIRFHTWLGLQSPAEHIAFDVEFDPTYALALFGAVAA